MEQGLTGDQQGDTFFKHSMRPDWGLAVLEYEGDGKKAFRFEDGKVRIFQKGYYELLQQVDTPVDHSARTLARLGSQSSETARSAKKQTVVPIDAQIMCFSEKYDGGFAGAAWQASRRGVGAKRRLKRHRDPAIAQAQSFLARDEMTRRMQAGEHAEIVAQLGSLLEETDLVSKKMAASIAVVFEERAIPLVQALHDLLHQTEGSLPVRFERWYTELERVCYNTPSWNLATAPLALAQPDRHVCVRSACFLRQASWMAPRLASERAVTGRSYKRWLAMADRMKTIFGEAGLGIPDNLDIHDFIVETLKASSIERALELHQARQ